MTSDRLLSVYADLEIEIGGRHLLLKGTGSQIVLELPSLVTAIKIVRSLGSFRLARARLVSISQTLAMTGLTVIVRTPNRRLITMGLEGKSNLLRLLGISNTQIHAF